MYKITIETAFCALLLCIYHNANVYATFVFCVSALSLLVV